MDISRIDVLSVSYNSAELVESLLKSFRRFYANPVTVLDGSDPAHVDAVRDVCRQHENVRFIHFDYNIHHGPGMAWGFQHLPLKGPTLVLDSDVVVLRPGMLESLAQALKPGMYGVGHVGLIDELGFNAEIPELGIKYLHPACMLCHPEVVRNWPMPIKHGSPMLAPMLALHRAHASHLLGAVPWVTDDFQPGFANKHHIQHDWQGTVRRTGSYHLGNDSAPALPSGESEQDLWTLVPDQARKVASTVSQAVGAAYDCEMVDARRLESGDFSSYRDIQVWLLGCALEKMRDPWRVLSCIRGVLPEDGCVVLSFSNGQNAHFVAHLAAGMCEYGSVLDVQQLRIFSRASMMTALVHAGFRVVSGYARMDGVAVSPQLSQQLWNLVGAQGGADVLVPGDCEPSHFVLKAVAA